MRQWNNDRPRAEAPADTIRQATGAEKARNRELADEDQDLWFQDAKLGVEPVGAVGDRGRGRLEVAVAGGVAAGEAAHERGDVGEASELFGACKPGTEHPPIELLPGAPGEWTAGLALNRTW